MHFLKTPLFHYVFLQKAEPNSPKINPKIYTLKPHWKQPSKSSKTLTANILEKAKKIPLEKQPKPHYQTLNNSQQDPKDSHCKPNIENSIRYQEKSLHPNQPENPFENSVNRA